MWPRSIDVIGFGTVCSKFVCARSFFLWHVISSRLIDKHLLLSFLLVSDYESGRRS